MTPAGHSNAGNGKPVSYFFTLIFMRDQSLEEEPLFGYIIIYEGPQTNINVCK